MYAAFPAGINATVAYATRILWRTFCPRWLRNLEKFQLTRKLMSYGQAIYRSFLRSRTAIFDSLSRPQICYWRSKLLSKKVVKAKKKNQFCSSGQPVIHEAYVQQERPRVGMFSIRTASPVAGINATPRLLSLGGCWLALCWANVNLKMHEKSRARTHAHRITGG